MSDFTLDELKLAFGYHIVRLILETDAVLTISEADFMERLFPRAHMGKAGFIGKDGGFTERHTQAMRDAVQTLPEQLELRDKLAFLTTFVQATLADGRFDAEEGGVLEQAARMLGVPDGAFDAHLDSLDDVGSVDLPEPEQE